MNPAVLQWLTVLGFCLVWGSSIIALVRRSAKKESDILLAITKTATDIDRVGEKVNRTNVLCDAHDVSVQSLKLEQQASRDDRNTMRERIAANATSINTLKEDMQTERLAVMTTLHNNERSAAERDASTREQLARISERLDIERLVTVVVRNLQGSVS